MNLSATAQDAAPHSVTAPPAELGTPLGAPVNYEMSNGSSPGTVHLLNFRWLRMLRWAAVVGQTLTILVVNRVLGVNLPLLPMGCVLLAEVLLNVAAIRRGRAGSELTERELATWVGMDLVAFSSLLYLSGGPANPFSFFYVVHVAMAALTLSARYAWTLVVISVLSYAALFLWNVPIRGPLHSSFLAEDLRLLGAWAAYALGASCIVYFVHRAREALRQRESMLAEQKDMMMQAERLSALGTLAAGAAHELANPLSTIAVVCKELEHELSANGPAQAMEDVELMRTQVERCRKILGRMANMAGEAPGESEQWLPLSRLLEESASELPERSRIRIAGLDRLGRQELRCPKEALEQTLRALLDNALDASQADVKLEATLENESLVLRVSDKGPGMAKDVLQRALDPFFTTKPTGSGMGLGLFLARNVATQLGGGLRLQSQPQVGTTAELKLPKDRLRVAPKAPNKEVSAG